MYIKESELIINDGRIYHLGLSKDELADIIITVGDPNRVKRVSLHFDKLECEVNKREFLTHTGYIGKKRISVIGTGIGPDNIDILMNEVDALKNIDFDTRTINPNPKSISIIRMGTSGALQKDIPVDSIIASSHGMGLDGLMNFYEFEQSNTQKEFLSLLEDFSPELFELCKPSFFPGSSKLRNIIADDLYSGITLTAGGFYAPQGRELRLKQKMRPIIDKIVDFSYKENKLSNFEMETSAIYGLSHLLGHQALSVNAIIANRPNGTFSKDPYKTIDRMIERTLQRISDSDLV